MARGTIIATVTKDGTKRYRTVIRINGKQQWRTWGKKGDAEDYLDNLSPEVRDRSYREIKKATFAEYLEIWKEINLNDKMLKPATINDYGSSIARWLLPTFKDYPMQAISADEISLFRTRLLKGDDDHRPLSAKTVRNILNLLNKIFSDARRAHYLKFNPMSDVERPKGSRSKKSRALKYDEFNAILEACGGRLRLMFLASCLSGLRRGELFGLPWENIDFENNAIKVRRELFWRFGKHQNIPEGTPKYVFQAPKSAASIRDVDLSPALRKELIEFRMKCGNPKKGLVFCSQDGTPLDPDNIISRDFAGALKKADAKRAEKNLPETGHVRWHDLRHTFGSWKIEQGENPYYVMRQMGHSSIQVTFDVYGHLLKDRNPEAAAKTDFLVFGG
jgi:integrase